MQMTKLLVVVVVVVEVVVVELTVGDTARDDVDTADVTALSATQRRRLLHCTAENVVMSSQYLQRWRFNIAVKVLVSINEVPP